MKKYWKSFSSIWLISLLVILILSGCAAADDQLPTRAKKTTPDEVIDSVKIIAYNQKNVEWVLDSKNIVRNYDIKQTLANIVTIHSYNENGTLRSVLTSQKADLNEIDNTITAIDSVVINSENGILKTGLLIWERNTDAITAPGKVTLIRDINTLYGYQLNTNIRLDFVQMKQVSAHGKIDKDSINW